MRTAAKSRELAPPALNAVELRLQCPQCGGALGSLREDDFPPEFLMSCTICRFQMLNEDGIWRALPPVRAAYFSRFIREYQTVRQAEGRGSDNPEYYFALPYQDLSGHNQQQWAIRSRTYRFLEHSILPGLEASRPGGLNVLDLGAGNGWMSYRLTLRGHRPVAVDLAASGDGRAGGWASLPAKIAPDVLALSGRTRPPAVRGSSVRSRDLQRLVSLFRGLRRDVRGSDPLRAPGWLHHCR